MLLQRVVNFTDIVSHESKLFHSVAPGRSKSFFPLEAETKPSRLVLSVLDPSENVITNSDEVKKIPLESSILNYFQKRCL